MRMRFNPLTVSLIIFASGSVLGQMQWTPVNNGITDLDTTDLIISELGGLYVGTENGKVFYSSDQGENWLDRSSGLPALPIGEMLKVPNDSLFVGTRHTNSSPDNGLFRSTDGGLSWQELSVSGVSDGAMCLALESDQTGRIYSSFDNMTARSIDNGDTWQALADLGSVIEVFLAVSDNELYAGDAFRLAGGRLRRTTDQGDSWSTVIEQPTATSHWDIAINYQGHLFFTVHEWSTGENIYRSTNGGATWRELTTGIPADNGRINTIAIRPSEFGDMFIGAGHGDDPRSDADIGVFRSTDNGDTWTRVSEGLTHFDVRRLVVAPDGTLYSATFGGGVFRSTITIPVQLSHFSVE